MGSQPLSWWRLMRKHIAEVGIIAASVLVITLIVGIIGGYFFNWDWTGLSRKTLWDWLQLLIIPAVLAVGALVFNLATARTEQKIAAQRYEQDQKIALEKQREDLLQVYLDRMSELLLKEKLRSSAVDAEVRNVARVRTITILFQLDARRIGYVFAFLLESGLMSSKSKESIVSLSQANLGKINLSQAPITGVDLRKAYLNEANLSGASLGGANLSGAFLREANLDEADLTGANLSGAFLNAANLSGVHLHGANLSDVDFTKANLSGAYLDGANLDEADFTEANLSGAILIRFNLKDTKDYDEQLKKAKSLKSAIMPDGSRHP